MMNGWNYMCMGPQWSSGEPDPAHTFCMGRASHHAFYASDGASYSFQRGRDDKAAICLTWHDLYQTVERVMSPQPLNESTHNLYGPDFISHVMHVGFMRIIRSSFLKK